MSNKKTKEQLKAFKKAREMLMVTFEIMKLGESYLIENMSVKLIMDRLVKYRKRTGRDIGLSYEETENGVRIFRRK